MFTCPVCFYGKMPDPPADYNICPCCGTEFENDDDTRSFEQLRSYWISSGAKWFFRQPPLMWNPWQQLADAGVPLPYRAVVRARSATPVVLNLLSASPANATFANVSQKESGVDAETSNANVLGMAA